MKDGEMSDGVGKDGVGWGWMWQEWRQRWGSVPSGKGDGKKGIGGLSAWTSPFKPYHFRYDK